MEWELDGRSGCRETAVRLLADPRDDPSVRAVIELLEQDMGRAAAHQAEWVCVVLALLRERQPADVELRVGLEERVNRRVHDSDMPMVVAERPFVLLQEKAS